MSPDLFEHADALMKQERWADVVAMVSPQDLAVRSDPRLAWTLGWAHFKLEDYATAAMWRERAAELRPAHPMYLGTFGAALVELERWEEAELVLLRSLALRDSGLARLDLAIVYMRTHRWDEAEAVHREGLRLRPDCEERRADFEAFLEDAGRKE